MTNRRKNFTRRDLLATGLSFSAGMLVPALGAGNLFAGAHEETSTDLLIIGAGPFGLAISAYAQDHGIRHKVVGVPMGFWRDNMPQSMYLRSSCDWSLDPVGNYSIYAYLEGLGKTCSQVTPLSRDFYLDYAGWMQRGRGIESTESIVTSLIPDDSGLVAVFANGKRIRSRAVVVAIGFKDFAHTPANLSAMFPAHQQGHTCFSVDFEGMADKRVLIVGGRMSAFEWTALIREAGAKAVHVSYRHDTPVFETSDWSWVNGIVDNMSKDPGWYRRLSTEEKKNLNHRFWVEGRKKLEPWLAPRIDHTNVHLHPKTNVMGTEVKEGGIDVELDNGDKFAVDHVVFATGYRMDVQRIPFLSDDLLRSLQVEQHYPVLDVNFQTNIPGLYMTSLAAARDFGSFMAFTVSARAQANVIGAAVKKQLEVHA